jgi:hypothetical protein
MRLAASSATLFGACKSFKERQLASLNKAKPAMFGNDGQSFFLMQLMDERRQKMAEFGYGRQ